MSPYIHTYIPIYNNTNIPYQGTQFQKVARYLHHSEQFTWMKSTSRVQQCLILGGGKALTLSISKSYQLGSSLPLEEVPDSAQVLSLPGLSSLFSCTTSSPALAGKQQKRIDWYFSPPPEPPRATPSSSVLALPLPLIKLSLLNKISMYPYMGKVV